MESTLIALFFLCSFICSVSIFFFTVNEVSDTSTFCLLMSMCIVLFFGSVIGLFGDVRFAKGDSGCDKSGYGVTGVLVRPSEKIQ